MGMLPSFLIIGTMKGGSSSLFRYIASNPDILPSSIKESDFFKTEADFHKGLDWYRNLFEGPGRLAFEASPNYTKRHVFGGVPRRIRSVFPRIKLIYLVRDPIDRIISHYVHNCAKGGERRLLSEALAEPGNNYIQTSRYYFQIEAFLEYFPRSQLLVVESERLEHDAEGVLRDVFTFLDVEPQWDSAILRKRFYESSKRKRRSALEKAVIDRTENRVCRAAARLIAAPFSERVMRPELSNADRTKLVDSLAHDVEELRRFSGLAFSSWSL